MREDRASTGWPTCRSSSTGWPDGSARFDPLERYNLVSDTWAAALAGRRPVADLLGLALALRHSDERDPSVWSVVLGALSLVDRVIPDGDRPVLAEAVRTLLSPWSTPSDSTLVPTTPSAPPL